MNIGADSLLHKQYRKIDRVGNCFLFFGIIIALVPCFMTVFEEIFPELFISGLMDGTIYSLFFGALFSILYGGLIDYYCCLKGYSFIHGLCSHSVKNSQAFLNYCALSKRYCSDCNISLITTSSLPFTNGGSNIDAKFGYDLGLVNEKEVKPFSRRFLRKGS